MFLAQLQRMGIPLGEVPSPKFIVVVMIVGSLFPDIPFWESLPLMVLAFVQNAAYSLQSRAANRTSNVYHFIAAVFATTVFFISLAYLIHLKVTLHVLLVYIFGTMLGSVYGTKLSVWIEKGIGAVAELGEEKKGQVLPLSKAVVGLSSLFVLQMLFIREFDIPAMFGIALAALVANILFAMLRIVRNTDAYWSHLAFVLVHATAGFFTYQILVEVNNWILFTPYLIGSVLGSLIGAEWGKRFGSFIKARWDAHSVPQDQMPTPYWQSIVCAALLIPQVWYFGIGEWFSQVLMLGAALLQTSAFTIVSRARQRNHELYLEWASVFSNGIWFITLNILVVHHLALYLWVPYLVGTGIGSLWGQAIAMRLEAEIGATMAAKPT